MHDTDVTWLHTSHRATAGKLTGHPPHPCADHPRQGARQPRACEV
ncbi:hypothetical protein OHU45_33180 [Streptomyces tubercidicus]|nr:hypothetical protein OG761_33165 [Streptomyces tubercidicus]WSX19083.1 hypothetical protein OG690_04185 [Streptomyces tubercidicus]